MAYGSTLTGASPGEINGLPKKVEKIGLRDFPTIQFRDDTPFSDGFFNIIEFPDSLTSGKNLFKLNATAGTLVKDAQIYIEILDSNKDPIYYEVLDYFEPDGTRVVTIHVTKNTPPGTAQVFIASRIKTNPDTGESITTSKDWNDPNYINNPNLLWTRTVPVGPNRLNSSEIIYTREPSVTVQEIVQPYMQPINLLNVETTKNGIGNFAINAEYMTQKVATEPGNPTGGTTTESTLVVGRSLMETTEPFFSASMVGGTITITNPTIQIYPISPESLGVFYDLILAATGVITDENGRVIPEANFGNPGTEVTDLGQYGSVVAAATASGNDVNDIVEVSGSYTFLISSILTSKKARIVQISGFAEPDLNTNGSFQIRQSIVAPTFINIDLPDPYIPSNIASVQHAEAYVQETYGGDSNYSASFIVPFQTIETEQTQSFAQITVSDMDPASGDVYKVRTLYKPGGMFGDYIDAGDTIVERVEILSDTASFESEASVGAFYNRIGFFSSLDDFNTYWTGSAAQFANNGVPLTASFTPDALISGITLSTGDNALPTSDVSATVAWDFGYFHLKPQYHPNVTANTRYVLSLKCYATDTTTSWNTTHHPNGDTWLPLPKLDLFISGSSVDNIIPDPATRYSYRTTPAEYDQELANAHAMQTSKFLNATHPAIGYRAGTQIGTVELHAGQSLQEVNINFSVTDTEPVDIFIVPRRGNWTIADVSIKTFKETGYTPNLAQINLRIPTQYINTPLTFKFQYLDYLSRQADLESVVYPVTFTGDNTVINGNYNLLSGSLYISNQIGTGMELAGAQSGFLRSTGYIGFKSASRTDQPGGFLIYSGSVLPNTPDSYQGVGLELVRDSSSFFRFKTDGNDAGLEIQTDKFFLGSEVSQYISGSSGNLEISSSNFRLSPEGNVTGSNILLTGNARADMIEFSNITLHNEDGFLTGSYLNIFTASNNNPYYELDLSNDGAMFIRLACHLNYPIARIKPPTMTADRAQMVFLEGAEGNPHYIADEGNPSEIDYEFGFDPGDLAEPSFQTRTITVPSSGMVGSTSGSVAYPRLFPLDTGARVMFVRGKFDWKIQSLSDYSINTASFGALELGDGTIITTANIDGGSF